MKKIILLLFVFLQLTISAQQVRGDLFIKGDVLTVSDYQILPYDGEYLVDNLNGKEEKASGFFVSFTFIPETDAQIKYFEKMFINGAKCSVKLKMWDTLQTGDGYICDVYLKDTVFFVKVRGDYLKGILQTQL